MKWNYTIDGEKFEPLKHSIDYSEAVKHNDNAFKPGTLSNIIDLPENKK